MAVLSAGTYVPTRNKEVSSRKAGVTDIFYQGGLAYLSTSGITPVSAAGLTFAGVCTKTISATIGDEVELMVGGEIGLANTNFNNTSPGRSAFCDVSAQSDNPADIIVSGVGTLATGDFSIGKVVNYNLNGYTWVLIETETEPTRIS